LFDTLDGTLARHTGQVTVFGAFLDSTLDRYSEAVTLIGLVVYYAGQPAAPCRLCCWPAPWPDR
jgi:CDP-diacylglycerol--glycerol-3-phosphate 3-phosphatidyltransferase